MDQYGIEFTDKLTKDEARHVVVLQQEQDLKENLCTGQITTSKNEITCNIKLNKIFHGIPVRHNKRKQYTSDHDIIIWLDACKVNKEQMGINSNEQ